jgi:signal transduction histidine kinase/DNA-binding response OmpR family regulator
MNTLLVILIVIGIILIALSAAILVHLILKKVRPDEIEELTQILFDVTPLAVNLWDKDFNNMKTNEEAVRLFKLSSKQEYLDRFFELSPEYQHDGIRTEDKGKAMLAKVIKDGYWRGEWIHKTLDGDIIPCELTMQRVKYRGEYAIAGFARDLRDIKETTEKMNEAYEAHKSLQIILDMLPVGITIVDPGNYTLLYNNNAFLEIFNFTSYEDQVKGRSVMEFISEYQPDGRKTSDVIAEMYRRNDSAIELQCLKAGGEPFIARISFIEILYKGIPASLTILEDMTEEKEYKLMLENTAAREQEANQLKSRFLATMSHEIRTPMNVILGVAEIQLQNEYNSPDAEMAFNSIYESGNLLLNIINDILDFSKIEAGKLEIMPFRYDIPSLINDTMQLNRLRYESKPIEFKLKVDENTPLDLFGDELRIKQILNNLISNAYKYTDKGEIELSVNFESDKQSEHSSLVEEVVIIFTVRDTGQGMTEEQVEKIFDEYTRFNLETNRAIIGAGLGMNITKRIVEMMDGKITVESRPGKGSVFTVRLPQKQIGREVCGADAVDKLQQYNYQSISRTKKARFIRDYMPYGSVMIVDDVESNLYVAKGMLVPYGLKIDAVESGFEAIEKIKEGNVYDIIFMDHMMPKMDGIEAVKIIRELGYKKRIVALTANAVAGQAEMFLNSGFDGYISKPIDSRELNAMLNIYIRDRQTPEVLAAAEKEREKKKDLLVQKAIKKDEVKKVFRHDAQKAISVLETLYPMLSSLKDEELQLYVTTVHGMKSTLLNIGERELSDLAGKLELAGRNKDNAVMFKDTPEFIEKLQKLIDKIKPAGEKEKIEISEEDAKYFKEKLIEIKAACEKFDINTAKAALTELKQKEWPAHDKEKIDTISGMLLHSAFKKTAAAIDGYL